MAADPFVWDIWETDFPSQLTLTSCQSYRALLAALTMPDMASHGVCWELPSSVCTQLGSMPWTGMWAAITLGGEEGFRVPQHPPSLSSLLCEMAQDILSS